MRRYLRDPMFSRFDTIPECDGHTHTHTQTDRQRDRQTDRHTTTAYTALSKASRGNKTSLWLRLKAVLGYYSPCFVTRDMNVLRKAFITYIRPMLECASSIWSPTQVGLIDRI